MTAITRSDTMSTVTIPKKDDKVITANGMFGKVEYKNSHGSIIRTLDGLIGPIKQEEIAAVLRFENQK